LASAQLPFPQEIYGQMRHPSGMFGYHPRPFIILIERAPEDVNEFFLGKFTSNPILHAQTNMWKVYLALGLPPDTVNKNTTIEVSKLNNTDPVLYRFQEKIDEAVLKDYTFQLGVKNETTVLGKPAEVLFNTLGDDKVYITYNLTEFGLVDVKWDFDDEGKGFDAFYKLPGGILGKREFVTLKPETDGSPQ